MTYLELPPDPRLVHAIECYWAVRSQASGKVDFRTILPDGCADIIFNFGPPLMSRANGEVYINTYKSFIVGNMTRPVQSGAQQHYDLLGIRFHPGGLHGLIPTPLDEFTDTMADLQYYPSLHHWFERLQEAAGLEKRYHLLNTLLLAQLRPASPKSVTMSLRKLQQHQGNIRIADLSREIGLSQKQLERQFKTVVGVTPKQMARVIQFRHMTTLLRTKGEDSLLQLAVDGGYSDHAHFTKAFKEFSGSTPQQFLAHQ
jgi:AraC-like DNA-binding protein